MKILKQVNRQLLHRRIVLVIFDIMTVCIASIAPLLIRFDMHYKEIPNIYLSSAWDFMMINIIITL